MAVTADTDLFSPLSRAPEPFDTSRIDSLWMEGLSQDAEDIKAAFREMSDLMREFSIWADGRPADVDGATLSSQLAEISQTESKQDHARQMLRLFQSSVQSALTTLSTSWVGDKDE